MLKNIKYRIWEIGAKGAEKLNNTYRNWCRRRRKTNKFMEIGAEGTEEPKKTLGKIGAGETKNT